MFLIHCKSLSGRQGLCCQTYLFRRRRGAQNSPYQASQRTTELLSVSKHSCPVVSRMMAEDASSWTGSPIAGAILAGQTLWKQRQALACAIHLSASHTADLIGATDTLRPDTLRANTLRLHQSYRHP